MVGMGCVRVALPGMCDEYQVLNGAHDKALSEENDQALSEENPSTPGSKLKFFRNNVQIL